MAMLLPCRMVRERSARTPLKEFVCAQAHTVVACIRKSNRWKFIVGLCMNTACTSFVLFGGSHDSEEQPLIVRYLWLSTSDFKNTRGSADRRPLSLAL
jgi:hypothetical protein